MLTYLTNHPLQSKHQSDQSLKPGINKSCSSKQMLYSFSALKVSKASFQDAIKVDLINAPKQKISTGKSVTLIHYHKYSKLCEHSISEPKELE